MSAVRTSPSLNLCDRDGSPKRSRNRRFSQTDATGFATESIRIVRSECLLDMIDEVEPRTPTPEELNSRAKGKLRLSTLVTSKEDRALAFDSCPYSAPVVPDHSISERRLSSHNRSVSILSLTGSLRAFESSPGSSPSTGTSFSTGRASPLSARNRVVGRLSSLLKRDKSISQPDFTSPESVKLDVILQMKERRDSLVDELLAEHARDASLYVRFISAFHEWNRVGDSKEKKQIAKKLTALFLDPSSMFYLRDVPKDLQQTVQQGHSESLTQLKEHLLDVLAENPHVVRYLSRCDIEERNAAAEN